MKKVARENSPDLLLGKSSSNDLFSYKLEPFSKSFRKKYQQIEPSTVNSTSNLIKTFSKGRIRPSQPLRDSPPKPPERRSHSKGHHSRPIDKISLASHAYQHAPAMPTTSKLLKLTAIFTKAGEGSAQELLQHLYEQNDEYLELLLEWQKLEIYDEVDKLVYKLTQIFTRMVESTLERTCKEMDDRLQTYETTVKRLET
jgi:hypothetical protein